MLKEISSTIEKLFVFYEGKSFVENTLCNTNKIFYEWSSLYNISASDNEFDVVYMDISENISDMEYVIREMQRVVTVEGHIIIKLYEKTSIFGEIFEPGILDISIN